MAAINGGGAMKKLPVIGLLIGLVAAGYALMRRKKPEPDIEVQGPPNTGDTTPPA